MNFHVSRIDTMVFVKQFDRFKNTFIKFITVKEITAEFLTMTGKSPQTIFWYISVIG